MKKIKNYAMALVALVIAVTSVTLMSFKKSDFSNAGWYEVNPPSGGNQAISSRIGDNLPAGDCQEMFSGEVCAVYWEDDNTTPPSTLSALLTADPDAPLAKHQEN